MLHNVLSSIATASRMRTACIGFLWACLYPQLVAAEFSLNFQPHFGYSDMKASIANVACVNGVSDNGQGRTDTGGCNSGYFKQEIVGDGFNQYYHVIIGDPAQDEFAQEFYIRTAGCCWFTKKPIFGEAPFSASWGDTTRRLSSAFFPLAGVTLTGNGTGNPARIYMKQINQDPDMTLEFNKTFESKKPKISQTVNDGQIVSDISIDMSNASYTQSTAPLVSNTLTFTLPDDPLFSSGNFDNSTDAQKEYANGGRFTYQGGGSFDGSYGTYTYDDAVYDHIDVDWLLYCNPYENTDRGCVGGPGGPMGP